MVNFFDHLKDFFIDRRQTGSDRRQQSRNTDRRNDHKPQFNKTEEWYLSASIEIEEISTDRANTNINTTDMPSETTADTKQKPVD